MFLFGDTFQIYLTMYMYLITIPRIGYETITQSS